MPHSLKVNTATQVNKAAGFVFFMDAYRFCFKKPFSTFSELRGSSVDLA